ncbi:MAG: histidine phosphatase family protein [Thermoleophilia bacterium]
MSEGGPEAWLVRHGETEWSRSGRHTGRTDVPLTEAGEAAARAVRDRLAGERFDLVLVSPALRARRTCEIAGFGDVAVVDPDAWEWDYGDYEGRTTADIRRAEPGWSVWTDPMPGGESLDAVAARADRVVARARAAGRTLVVSHGHLLRILAARWLGMPPAAGAHLVLGTATLSTLGWERETPALLRWNS